MFDFDGLLFWAFKVTLFMSMVLMVLWQFYGLVVYWRWLRRKFREVINKWEN